MTKQIFNIEDLTQVLSVSRPERPARSDDEDLSIPIVIEDLSDDEIDVTLHLVDDLVDQEQPIFVFDEGRYLRYRIGVLGLGHVVEQIFAGLKATLAEAVDPLVENLNLWAKYQVALFGGVPRGEVTATDAHLLADRLDLFKPNYLVLVTAGQMTLADATPQQLAQLTLRVNSGAVERRQRPYSLVLVTDKEIGQQSFSMYRRLCVTMNTYPAEAQLRPKQIDRLAGHARRTLLTYTEDHLRVRP